MIKMYKKRRQHKKKGQKRIKRKTNGYNVKKKLIKRIKTDKT